MNTIKSKIIKYLFVIDILIRLRITMVLPKFDSPPSMQWDCNVSFQQPSEKVRQSAWWRMQTKSQQEEQELRTQLDWIAEYHEEQRGAALSLSAHCTGSEYHWYWGNIVTLDHVMIRIMSGFNRKRNLGVQDKGNKMSNVFWTGSKLLLIIEVCETEMN